MESPTSTWRNLIRFQDQLSKEHYGDADTTDLDKLIGSRVPTFEGPFNNLHPTGSSAVVHKLLSPVPSPPLIVCVGLNYADHAREANLSIPPNPVIFTKPAGKKAGFVLIDESLDAVTGPVSDILVPSEARHLDYEPELMVIYTISSQAELCVVISRTGKNIPEEKAYDYILGFTAGNDISSRFWQRQPYSGGQFCYAKSFDTFAPLGPTLLHPSQLPRGEHLDIKTFVNGEKRQDSNTGEMIFNVEKIIAHASYGTTLRAGTVIMTGTPAGVAAKLPGQPWLKHGDIVEVEIGRVGRIKNQIVFE
ncbi:unnamed protein product [Clonostachys solani]|uniref:Fumarylacetoacetase-like C-terminal domain-containing protein n=1 Tax=Clonostachys solani TaxID=160281 RepID=A0A9P0EPN9_9HYPO|nr:unnamed protein product [Clonostachys solani]